jgi:hypothetical protein
VTGRAGVKPGDIYTQRWGRTFVVCCLIDGDATESSKRFETMTDALHALVGSGRVKREYD